MARSTRIRRFVTAGPRLFARLSAREERSLADALRAETTGGALLLVGTVIALVWANSGWSDAYEHLREIVVGPSALHLDLSIEHWASDGLLTFFFFVVGLELKREIVAGELRKPATAALPIVAAIGGMAVPALLYVAVNAGRGDLSGWAIPTATDIAFAVAVLAVVGRSLPSSLRAFLLTLAVVDDLLAIIVIAVFYSESISLGWLALSVLVVVVFGLLTRRGITSAWLLVPLGVTAWALMHASGVHATIAGVLLGLIVPATAAAGEHSIAERFEHRWRPISAGVAVPIFALVAAGVAFDPESLSAALQDPVAQGVVLGLVVGKPIGIIGTTWIVSRLTKTPLAEGLGWRDVAAVGSVAGIGFTVSLLIGALAFDEGSAAGEHVRVAVLAASIVAAIVGALLLARRDRHHRRKEFARDQLSAR